MRGTPPAALFVPLTEQLANIRRWNDEQGWGLLDTELDAIDLAPRRHTDSLVVDLIAVYLDEGYVGEDVGYLDGVRRTCHELWTVVTHRQPQAWSWDWLRDAYQHQPKPVRLLPGLVHRPGVRRVTVDLGAHWTPGRHVRPRKLRGPDSAHAEVLAAAAHFPTWARAMDGHRVPYIWLSGYQVTFPAESADRRLPGLAWVNYRRTLSLTVDWVDHSHSGWAAPVLVGS
ncbi:hypothetical protein BH20ACT5_BH20ACT5_23660 [soil metagenome]